MNAVRGNIKNTKINTKTVETKESKSRSNTNEKLLSNAELPSFISMSFSQRLVEEDGPVQLSKDQTDQKDK